MINNKYQGEIWLHIAVVAFMSIRNLIKLFLFLRTYKTSTKYTKFKILPNFLFCGSFILKAQ